MAALLGRIEHDANRLWREHPARIRHPKKHALLALAGGVEREPKGDPNATAWSTRSTRAGSSGEPRTGTEN